MTSKNNVGQQYKCLACMPCIGWHGKFNHELKVCSNNSPVKNTNSQGKNDTTPNSGCRNLNFDQQIIIHDRFTSFSA